MTLRIITKNHGADPEKGFLTKSISKPNGCSTAMPTAWELNKAHEAGRKLALKFKTFELVIESSWLLNQALNLSLRRSS